MNPFVFYSPTKFVFGEDRETEVGAYAKEFGATKVLVLYGGVSAQKSGLLNSVQLSLRKEGLPFVCVGGVRPNPRSGLVYESIALCRKERVDFILAVGGGSVIDSAKAIAMGVPYSGDFWDFFMGRATLQQALPVGTVLTIAAAGSEGSPDTVITQEDGMLKYGFGSDLLRPKFSVLNPALLKTLPPYQMACGVVDMMAHVFERYFTNTQGVETTDRLCEGLLLSMLRAGKAAMEDPADLDALGDLLWAGTVAHNNLCGVGRTQDWASHNLEHSLSALYDCAHGAGLAVVMPAWMEYVLPHDVMRFARLAERVFGCPMDAACPENTARAGIAALRAFWRALQMPADFAELGARPEDIPAFLEHLGIGGGTLGNFVPLDMDACRAVYEIAAAPRAV